MRQVFNSPRLENVESVAALLREHDIEIRITNGRSYRSGIRGNFSYRDKPGADPHPAVWIARSEQQPLARQVLREAGLMPSGPSTDDSYLPPELQFRASTPEADGKRRRSRMRLGLLALVAVATSLVLVASRRGPAQPDDLDPRASGVSSVAASPTIASPDSYILPVPPALATTLFRRTFHSARGRAICLAVDGVDPIPEVLSQLVETGHRAMAASSCNAAQDALLIEARQYRTDGSGTGTIELIIQTRQAGTTIDTDRLRLTVQREDALWRVLDES